MRVSAERLKVLLGSRSALSAPVIIGLSITGFMLNFTYIQLIPGQPRFVTVIAAAGAAGVSTVVLLMARAIGNRDGWARNHAAIVLVGFVLSSLVRTLATSLFVNWRSAGQEISSNAPTRTIATLLITVALGGILAASATLARERSEANNALLVEQARLRQFAANADEELIRAGVELREKARLLLEPTIEGIRELISGEISEIAVLKVSERINAAVKDVVRPATRELARSPLFARDEPMMGESTPLSLIKGRMDVTQAIKPWWWLAVSWGVLIPGPLILGAQISVILQWIAVSLIAVLLFLVVKAVWPRRLRNMPIPLGLGVLLILYSLTSVGFEYLASQVLPRIASAETWASNNLAGSIIRISLCMLVSILATLDVHGRQTRATLLETNIELEELIARIKRETWLLHRSVSLAVHGTVQSALISTAMRLSAPNRTHEIVEDARRRLEDALTSISVDQHEDSSVVSALEDLQGLWEPMVTIDFEISDSARVRLVEDSGLRSCVIEICREAVSNAIRHGHSVSVNLVVDVSDELLRIRVTDDGKSSNLDSPAGLGSQMLDETCLRWSRVRRPGDGSELVALLA